MVYQLNDSKSMKSLGLVEVIQSNDKVYSLDDISESWEEFNKLEEHDEGLDHQNVNHFVQWHNRNRVIQIQRVSVFIIQH